MLSGPLSFTSDAKRTRRCLYYNNMTFTVEKETENEKNKAFTLGARM